MYFILEVDQYILVKYYSKDFFQFFHPAYILWVIFTSSSPSCATAGPRYLNYSTLFNTPLCDPTSPFSLSFNLKHFVFILLIYSPLSSISLFHSSSFSSTTSHLVLHSMLSSSHLQKAYFMVTDLKYPGSLLYIHDQIKQISAQSRSLM